MLRARRFMLARPSPWRAAATSKPQPLSAMVMPTEVISSRIARLFTPPLYEALAEEKYYNYQPPPESGITATVEEEAAESATAA